MSEQLYEVVWIETGEPYPGTIPPAPDEARVKQALAEMLEEVSELRGKLEVKEKV
jgi:hypothetical protein